MRRELELYLRKLKGEQEGCIALLATPKDKSAYGYGEASGILQGLNRAEKLLERVIEEVADDAAE
jgi:hypothetical protein